MVFVDKINNADLAGNEGGTSDILTDTVPEHVPAWCVILMEGGLWLAILCAALFAAVLSPAATCLICFLLILVSWIMWLLHFHYLRRTILFGSRILWILAVVLAGIFFIESVFHWNVLAVDSPPYQWFSIVLCFMIFLIVSGGFTEAQVGRLFAFLAAVGVVEVVAGLHMIGDAARGPAAFAVISSVAGTLGTEWRFGAFLLCGILSGATFAVRMLVKNEVHPRDAVFHSRVNRFTSPSASMAMVGAAAIVLMIVAAFLAGSIFLFPIIILSMVVFFLLLAFKKRAWALFSAGAVVVCLALIAANLARPAGVRWGLSGAVLKSNARSLVSLEDTRAVDTEDPRTHTVQPAGSLGSDNNHVDRTGQKNPWPVLAVFAGIIICLAIYALQGYVRFDENQPILAAGALSIIIGVTFLSAFEVCLDNLGVAFAFSAVCAVAATGGDFEEEFEEE